MDSFENSLKNSPEIIAIRDAAFNEAKLKGKLEGKTQVKREIAKALNEMGVSIDLISHATEISESEIENL